MDAAVNSMNSDNVNGTGYTISQIRISLEITVCSCCYLYFRDLAIYSFQTCTTKNKDFE